jgi:hypothetical protein
MTNPNATPAPANQIATPRVIEPEVLALVQDPTNQAGASDAERHAAFERAKQLSDADAGGYKRIVHDKTGEAHWANEYPNVFSFDGQIRGDFDWVHRDVQKRPPEQHLVANHDAIGGPVTDVIIETDMGEKVLIRKTSGDTKSAMKQTFDLISLNMARDAVKKGEVPQARPIDTKTLAGIVLIPGMPMRLGIDPRTGMTPRTQGNITKITGLKMNDAGKVAPNHPMLKDPQRYSSARENFNAAIRAEEQRLGTLGAGSMAVGATVAKPNLTLVQPPVPPKVP